MSYCDNCGEHAETQAMFNYSELPFDVASAHAGESGSVCVECNNKQTERGKQCHTS